MIACDTSFLISRFVREPNHEKTKALLAEAAGPLFLSRLNQLEFETATRRMVGTGQLTEEEADRVLSEFARMTLIKSFELQDADDDAVWSRSMVLAGHYAASLMVRTLDIWHVAFALEMGARKFWSFDDRQRKLAEMVGLKVNP